MYFKKLMENDIKDVLMEAKKKFEINAWLFSSCTIPMNF